MGELKTLVLDSVSSPITKRVYNMALDEFLGWFQQAPRPGFTKATVSAWRVSLEDRKLGSSSIVVRMSAIRKLAAEGRALPPMPKWVKVAIDAWTDTAVLADGHVLSP